MVRLCNRTIASCAESFTRHTVLLQVLYMVGLPLPLRWVFRASMQLLHVHTRRKIRLCRVTDVPRRLPSQLRSHKLSVGAGLNDWGDLMDETGSFWEGRDGSGPVQGNGATGAGSVIGSDVGDFYPSTPITPHSRGLAAGGGGRRGFRWRRGGRHVSSGEAAVQNRRVKQGSIVFRVWSGVTVVVGLLVLYLLFLQQLFARSL